DPLPRFHAGINRQPPPEWTAQDAHGIASTRRLRLGQFDKPATLTRSDLVNDGIGHPRRHHARHDDAGYPRRPARLTPLQLDGDECVARKQRRIDLDAAATQHTMLTQPWRVDGKAGQTQTVRRQRLAPRLELRTGPERHDLERALATALKPWL